jgi:hypothetical protein
MELAEAERLRDELWKMASLGPGPADDLTAGNLKGIISALRDGDIGADALGKLTAIESGFATLFSVRKWKQWDESGQSCKRFVLDDITVMQWCIERYLKSKQTPLPLP